MLISIIKIGSYQYQCDINYQNILLPILPFLLINISLSMHWAALLYGSLIYAFLTHAFLIYGTIRHVGNFLGLVFYYLSKLISQNTFCLDLPVRYEGCFWNDVSGGIESELFICWFTGQMWLGNWRIHGSPYDDFRLRLCKKIDSTKSLNDWVM